ncbi:MAG: cell division protein ZapA [Gammaproteobacteria bacterium]|nr:cell division protein ZapA [Gammaproteobacteria bacterium]MCP4881554.1 cell division protein ZapA [Gammaproteobacteria bacterium]MDP6165996.1 cell division protein ZapA [Gammaproteobacteria bacterium]
MSNNVAVQISILNQSYTLTSPAGKEEQLREAAQILDTRLRAIKDSGRVVGLERMAVMAALNFSAETLQIRKEMTTLETAISQLDNKILQQLELNQELSDSPA